MPDEQRQGRGASHTRAWSGPKDLERMEAKRLEKMQTHASSHRVVTHPPSDRQKPK